MRPRPRSGCEGLPFGHPRGMRISTRRTIQRPRKGFRPDIQVLHLWSLALGPAMVFAVFVGLQLVAPQRTRAALPVSRARGAGATHREHRPQNHATGIWRPAPGTTWQWQIVGKIGRLRNVQMYDVDLQDAVPSARTVRVPGFGAARWPAGQNAGIIKRLHAHGIVAICYLDSGAWESYRPDARLFPRTVIGNSTGWAGERWLDIRPSSWKRFAPIIWARFRLAKQIGCDGIEPDENNPIGNRPGFPITLKDEYRWYLKVAAEAHALGLSVGMKNGVEVLDKRLAHVFDWSLNEECVYYHECGREHPFIAAHRAVFQAEYTADWKHRGLRSLAAVAARVCPASLHQGFSTLVKRIVPNAAFVPCSARSGRSRVGVVGGQASR